MEKNRIELGIAGAACMAAALASAPMQTHASDVSPEDATRVFCPGESTPSECDVSKDGHTITFTNWNGVQVEGKMVCPSDYRFGGEDVTNGLVQLISVAAADEREFQTAIPATPRQANREIECQKDGADSTKVTIKLIPKEKPARPAGTPADPSRETKHAVNFTLGSDFLLRKGGTSAVQGNPNFDGMVSYDHAVAHSRYGETLFITGGAEAILTPEFALSRNPRKTDRYRMILGRGGVRYNPPGNHFSLHSSIGVGANLPGENDFVADGKAGIELQTRNGIFALGLDFARGLLWEGETGQRLDFMSAGASLRIGFPFTTR